MGDWGKKKPSALDELKKRVKENRLSGVYLFWGEEEYTKDFYAAKLRKLATDAPVPEFNYLLFDAEKYTAGDFEEATFVLPYLWEHRVIEIRNLSPGGLSAEEGERYARIFASVPDYLTVLVLLRSDAYAGGKGDKAQEKKNGFRAFLTAVEENGLSVEFEPEKGEKLCAWVAKHFAARYVPISQGLPSALIAYCGTDMYTLQGEIGKLCDAYEGTPLTEREMRAYCCPNESYVFFDVAACMTRNDLAGARRILSGLRMTPDTVMMAIGYLASHYQLLSLVKAGLDSGKSVSQISSEQKQPTWKVQKAASAVVNTDAPRLRNAVREIAAADTRLKGTRADPRAVLELLLYRICSYER